MIAISSHTLSILISPHWQVYQICQEANSSPEDLAPIVLPYTDTGPATAVQPLAPASTPTAVGGQNQRGLDHARMFTDCFSSRCDSGKHFARVCAAVSLEPECRVLCRTRGTGMLAEQSKQNPLLIQRERRGRLWMQKGMRPLLHWCNSSFQILNGNGFAFYPHNN